MRIAARLKSWSAAALVAASGGLYAAEPPADSVADVEAQLVEQKLDLARAYRFRGERDKAFELVREALSVRPAEPRAAQLAVELWLEGWDEQLVTHLESAPDQVALDALGGHVDAAQVGAALIDALGRRQDLQYTRDVALVAPYLRADDAAALGKLLEEGRQAQAVVAASLLSVLGDERGDKYIGELLTEAPWRDTRWSASMLLAYASPAVWEKVAACQDPYAARSAVLDLGHAGGEHARELLETLAESYQMVVQDAAITALTEIGATNEAATALGKFRMRYWRGTASGGIGHKLLISYARLGDEKHFFEIFDGFEEDLRSGAARMLAAQMHMAAGRRAEAEAVIQPVVDEAEAAIKAEPERADNYLHLAETLGVAGIDPARARQMAFAALEHHPSTALRPAVYGLLAELYLREGKLERARVAADAAVALYSEDHPRYIGLQRRVDAAQKAASGAQ